MHLPRRFLPFLCALLLVTPAAAAGYQYRVPIPNLVVQSGCVSGTQAFTPSAGASVTWTIPTNCSTLTVEAWGAGGASSGGNNAGGGGGFAQGTLTHVSNGTTFEIVVGLPGAGMSAGAPGGGAGGANGGYGAGGGGGGYSAVTLSSGQPLLIAGGGGGGGAADNGGAGGGGTTGQDGANPGGGQQGHGGTQSYGGAYGAFTAGCGAAPTSGSLYQGGIGQESAGGGGGGYFGGGGGATFGFIAACGGGGTGGGGSGYLAPTLVSTSLLTAAGNTQANASNPDNQGAGAGGAPGVPARGGRVVLTWGP